MGVVYRRVANLSSVVVGNDRPRNDFGRVERPQASVPVRKELDNRDILAMRIVRHAELGRAFRLSRRRAGSDHGPHGIVRHLAEGNRHLAGFESVREAGHAREGGVRVSKHGGIVPERREAVK